MTRNQELELVRHAAHSLQQALEAAQVSDTHVANAQQALAALRTLYGPDVPVPASAPRVRTAIANGHRLREEEFRRQAEDDYDVILDMTNHILRYRRDPVQHTPLIPSSLEGIGPERLKVCAFLLGHPSRRICADTLPPLLGEPDEIMEPEALAQTILRLRKALGTPGPQNPYIMTEPAWGESRRRGAGVYVLNSKWKYLFIQWESEITGKS